MNILITGGAGYIGSHVAKLLLENTDHNIFIIDNLSSGDIRTLDTLKNIRNFIFFQVDLKEFEKTDDILKENKIHTIFHFAASIEVGESLKKPIKYYMNNTVNTVNLIDSAIRNGTKKFIFSSTAAVYGEPIDISSNGIDENTPPFPINPYGMSKLMSENIIKDAAKLNKDFKYVIFRYFNVSGSDINYQNEKLNPRIGECHKPETHLIPLIIQTALKKRDKFSIYGNDFNTEDGTCIRDYIHVEDLAQAHIQAMKYLDNNISDVFNVGYGKGYSVKNVVKTIKEIAEDDFEVDITTRRIGDPAILVADNRKIKEKMDWIPNYDSLDFICKSAFEWEKQKKSTSLF